MNAKPFWEVKSLAEMSPVHHDREGRLLPPLTIGEAQVDEALSRMGAALEA